MNELEVSPPNQDYPIPCTYCETRGWVKDKSAFRPKTPICLRCVARGNSYITKHHKPEFKESVEEVANLIKELPYEEEITTTDIRHELGWHNTYGDFLRPFLAEYICNGTIRIGRFLNGVGGHTYVKPDPENITKCSYLQKEGNKENCTFFRVEGGKYNELERIVNKEYIEHDIDYSGKPIINVIIMFKDIKKGLEAANFIHDFLTVDQVAKATKLRVTSIRSFFRYGTTECMPWLFVISDDGKIKLNMAGLYGLESRHRKEK